MARRISSVWLLGWICNRRENGAIFCHVARMRPVVRLRPCITSGSQVWRGARPIFKASAMVIMVVGTGWVTCCSSHWPVIQALVVAARRRVAAAAAWVKKYFVVASMARGWCCCAISGMMARVLISSPIHAISQCVLVVAIVVPKSRPNRREVVM